MNVCKIDEKPHRHTVHPYGLHLLLRLPPRPFPRLGPAALAAIALGRLPGNRSNGHGYDRSRALASGFAVAPNLPVTDLACRAILDVTAVALQLKSLNSRSRGISVDPGFRLPTRRP